MINVPYCKQEFHFSCMCACVRMLLDFYGIKVEEIELRKLFNTTSLFGTKWSNIEERIGKYNLEFIYLKNLF